MTDIVIIPARAGSVGVQGKNKKILGGIPLIAHTVNFAKQFLSSVDIVVSTDDVEIYKMYKDDPDLICRELRPKKLSQSNALTKDVVSFEFEKLKNKYQNIWLLQPTCPYRKVETFHKCMKFLDQDFTSVVTVKDVGGEHPLRMKRLVGNHLINYVDTGKENMDPRQNLPKVYLRSGGIYGIKSKIFEQLGELVSDKCAGVVVEGNETINIDTPLDFKLAEFIGLDG